MQLTFDDSVEAFRAEFTSFLDQHLPPEAQTGERARSSSYLPLWARRWQNLLFDYGWLVPGNAPRFGGRDATVLQQYVHAEELSRRRIYPSFNPQGVNVVAAAIISFGTEDQKDRWAIPILRADITASLGMSEPGAGSDLASLRTRADRHGDHFIVNGQKVWTSGAHDADVLLAFVRTDIDAPKHRGISAMLIPTDAKGVVRRPFASICDRGDLDFNEVFFTDVQVPAENLVGELNKGWLVVNGSLGHERTMLWLSYADRLEAALSDYSPTSELDKNRYATSVMDAQALRLLGSTALARATRGQENTAALSVLKLLGGEAEQHACEHFLAASGPMGLTHPASSGPYAHMNLDQFAASWFERYTRTFGNTIAGGTSEIHRNIIAQRLLGLPRS